MNDNTRFLMGLYQVALLIGNALDYSVILPVENEEFKKDMVTRYENRARVYEHFLAPGSPMEYFCRRNDHATNPDISEEASVGGKIMGQLQEFSTDVYGNNRTEESNTPVVSLINNANGEKEVRIESSKINHLFDMIAGLHQTVMDAVIGHLDYYKKTANDEQTDFVDLLQKYEHFYISNFMLSISINIAEKFNEYNSVVRSAIETARRNGIDTNSSSFKVEEDPTVHFVITELNQLLGLVGFVRGKIHFETDELKASFAEYDDQLNYFKGTKQFPANATIADVLKGFYMIFNDNLKKFSDEWKPAHESLYQDLVKYEQEVMNKLQAQNNNESEA